MVFRLVKNLLQLISSNRLLSLVILIGTILRFWGVVPGYLPYHSDEHQSWAVATRLIFEQKLHPDYYAYPSLIPLIHAVFYVIIFIPLTLLHDLFIYSNIEAIKQQMITDSLYWGRYVNAFLGSASILLVYILGKKFWNKQSLFFGIPQNKFIGLTAAIFLAVNYRHVLQSHFALFDISNGLFLILTLLVALLIFQQDKKINYFWGGVVCALSFSVKFFPFGFASVLLSHVVKKPLSPWVASKKFWLMLFFLSSVFFIVTALLNFPHLVNFSKSQEYLGYLAFKYRTGIYTLITYPYLYLYKWGLGPILSFLVIFGAFLGLKNKFRESLILLVPVLFSFFSLTFFSHGGLYVRNFIGVIPILLLFASVGVYALSCIKHLGRIMAGFLVVLALWPHITNSLILDFYYSKPWALTQAKEYLTSEIASKTIAGDHWVINYLIFPDGISKKKDITKVTFDPRESFTLTELQDASVDFVLVDTGFTERFFIWWMSKDFFTGVPSNLLRQTFAGSVIYELTTRRDKEWVKPWQAYENNLFLVPIPKRPGDFVGKVVYREDFENLVDWAVKGTMGERVVDTSIKQVSDDRHCIGHGCAFLGYTSGPGFKFRTFGTLSFTSPPFAVEKNYLYKVQVKIKTSSKLPKGVRDGFFKVELFKKREDAEKDIPGDVIFVSARYKDNEDSWLQREVFVDIPAGFEYLTVSFQVSDNRGETFYFDDLVIEKSLEPLKEGIPRKSFPEDIIFLNSIL